MCREGGDRFEKSGQLRKVDLARISLRLDIGCERDGEEEEEFKGGS